MGRPRWNKTRVFAGGARSPKGNESGRSTNLGRKIGNRRVETHARPSILSYFTEKTKCTDPPFRLLPSGSAVKDPVTVGWRERFHFSSRISSKSRVLLAADPRPAIISYIGPTSASKPASPGFKFSKLDDWPFQEWNLLTNSEDGSTIQLLCGEISN